MDKIGFVLSDEECEGLDAPVKAGVDRYAEIVGHGIGYSLAGGSRFFGLGIVKRVFIGRRGGFQQLGGVLLEKLLKEVLEKLLASFAAKPETGVVAGKDWA